MSLSLDVRHRLQAIASEWREAAGYGKPIRISANEATEVAAALTATLNELDQLRAEVEALRSVGGVVLVAAVPA